MWLMVIRTVCKNYLITPRVSNARKIRYVTNNSNILAEVHLTRGLMVRNDKYIASEVRVRHQSVL